MSNYGNRLTPETKQQIIEALNDLSLTYREVARTFGVGFGTVKGLALSAGLARTTKLQMSSVKAKRLADRNQKILDAIKANPTLSYKKIAELTGSTHGIVRELTRKSGYSQVKVDALSDRDQEILDALVSNPQATFTQIAELVDCSPQQAARVAKDNGQPSRSRKGRHSHIESWLIKNYDGDAIAAAQRFGVPVPTIACLVNKHGLAKKHHVVDAFSFEEARAWVQSQGIRTAKQFNERKRHPRMPVNPHGFYSNQWKGWAHFLCQFGKNRWTSTTILAFLEEIKSTLPALADHDLIQILKANTKAGRGLLPTLARIIRTERITDVIRALRNNEVPALAAAYTGNLNADGGEFQVVEDDDYESTEIGLDPDMLHTADHLAAANIGEAVVLGVVDSHVCSLRAEWVRNGDPASAMKKIRDAGVGGKLFQEIKKRFLADVAATEALPTPEWNLHQNGELTKPFPMQKFVAWRITQDRTFCNWSGTGAGKTGSAGLASFAIDSNLTVVIAPNSMAGADGWVRALADEFKSVTVYSDPAELKRGKGVFLVLNYEKFQGRGARRLIDKILVLKPDLFILDEAHLVKVRGKSARSRRSIAIEGMLLKSGAKVLGMTATPVINELSEAISLLQIVKGEKQNLRVRNTVNSAMDTFQQLRQNGARFVPNYKQDEVISEVQVRRDDLADALYDATERGVLGIEQALIHPKLEAIRSFITKGTIIYVQYVDGIVSQVRAFVENLGLTVGEYVGDKDTKRRAEAKRKFIAGETDVLVASSAIKLGVDGLQETCNRMILLSLPWTHSDFLQVIGRIRRTGSKFEKAYIYIPQIVLGDGENQISWDESRLDHIEGKRTLADCAVDGVVPTDTEATKDFLVERVKKVLKRLTRKAATASGN